MLCRLGRGRCFHPKRRVSGAPTFPTADPQRILCINRIGAPWMGPPERSIQPGSKGLWPLAGERERTASSRLLILRASAALSRPSPRLYRAGQSPRTRLWSHCRLRASLTAAFALNFFLAASDSQASSPRVSPVGSSRMWGAHVGGAGPWDDSIGGWRWAARLFGGIASHAKVWLRGFSGKKRT